MTKQSRKGFFFALEADGVSEVNEVTAHGLGKSAEDSNETTFAFGGF